MVVCSMCFCSGTGHTGTAVCGVWSCLKHRAKLNVGGLEMVTLRPGSESLLIISLQLVMGVELSVVCFVACIRVLSILCCCQQMGGAYSTLASS